MATSGMSDKSNMPNVQDGMLWTKTNDDQYFSLAATTVPVVATALSQTGTTGDFLKRVICIPSVALAGRVEIIDGTSTFSVYPGNATLADLKPFVVEVGAISRNGAWRATVGTSMGIVGVGRFT